MCPHTTTCVLILLYGSLYHYICFLILLYMCPHTTIYVSAFYYVCVCVLMLLYYMSLSLSLSLSHTHTHTKAPLVITHQHPIYSVLMLLYVVVCRARPYKFPHTTIHVSSYYYICVLILLCMCPHTTIYVSPYYYISRRARQLAQDPPAARLHSSRGARCLAPHFT
jgi:hypothetical protein